MRFAWLVLAGCFDPTFIERVPCSATEPCPGGQTCKGGVCNGADPDPPNDGPGAGSDAPGGGDGDTCATTISLSLTGTTIGTLAGAADDVAPPSGCGTNGVEVIYSFTLESSTNLSFKVNSPDFTGNAYTAQTCPATSFRTCTGIATNGGSAGVTFQPGTVFLFVERNAGTGTTFDINPN